MIVPAALGRTIDAGCTIWRPPQLRCTLKEQHGADHGAGDGWRDDLGWITNPTPCSSPNNQVPVSRTGLNTTGLFFGIYCGATSPSVCTPGGSEHSVQARMYSIAVTLSETALPSVSNLARPASAAAMPDGSEREPAVEQHAWLSSAASAPRVLRRTPAWSWKQARLVTGLRQTRSQRAIIGVRAGSSLGAEC